MTLNLIIADDHDLVREAIASLLQKDGENRVETFGTLEEVSRRLAQGTPIDLVFLDYDMPGMNGLTGLAALRRAHPSVPVAIISGTAQPSVAREALEAGAIGFVPKSLPARSIQGAVALMASGSVFAPFEFLSQKAPAGIADLTDREASVLRRICEGQTNKEIARELGLQEVTIKLHVRTLSRKLNARNRTHAAMIAREAKWF